MEPELNETVGLGHMVDRVAALTKIGEARLDVFPLPRQALPPGLLVEDPHILVITDGKGGVTTKTLASEIEALRGKPSRRKGTATATTLASFCDLVNRNGDDATAIFVDANWKAPKLRAVLNYHRSASASATADADADADADDPTAASPAGDDPLARFGDHRVDYAFPLSEPWQVWVAMNGKVMAQADFASFLEDHIHEIAGRDDDADSMDARWEEMFRTRIATPNELIDLARGLEVLVGHKIASKVRLQGGETSLVFDVEHRDSQGNALTVPGLFILRIPIFYRGVPQRMLVRLRYRPAGDKGVLWFYELHRPDEAVDERVRADVGEVGYQTGRPVYDGAPEVTG